MDIRTGVFPKIEHRFKRYTHARAAVPPMPAVLKKAQRILPLTYKIAMPDHVIDLGRIVNLPPGFFPTNPAILKLGNDLLINMRGVNYTLAPGCMTPIFTGEKRYRTINRMFLLAPDFATTHPLPHLDEALTGIEDIKLFAFAGEIWGIGSRIVDESDNSCRMVLIRISRDLKSITCQELASPFGLRQEKNWSPFVQDGHLYFLYSYHPLVILRYLAERGTVECLDPHCADYSPQSFPFLICGSSPGLETPTGYLFVAHRRSVRIPRLNRAYVSRLYHLDSGLSHMRRGPYFVIEGPAIQFVNGLAMDQTSAYLSYGQDDHSAYLAIFDKSTFLKNFA